MNTHRHRRSLDQGLAVGPLDALQLRPAGDEEADHRAALALLRLGGGLTALLGLLAASLALLLLAAPLPSADSVRGRLRGGADVGARRRRRRQVLGVRLVAGASAATGLRQRLEVGAALGQLRLGHVGRFRYLGSLLGAAVRAARALRLARGALLARSPLCLPLRPRLRHRYTSPRSAGLLMRGVAATPVAVLAQLEPVGSVATRLVGLVVASLALLAGERDGDSDFSAGHWLVVIPLSEQRRSPLAWGEGARGAQKDSTPTPRLRRGERGGARIAPPSCRSQWPAASAWAAQSPSVLAMMLRWISEVPP